MSVLRRAGALVCLVPVLAVLPSAHASAEEAVNLNRFTLTAEGNGMFMEYRGTAAPATDNISASPWASFATVNSQGLSRAFAGLPYFGAFLQTLPGTVNGLSGGATPPIPPLPGFTESKFPSTPQGRQSQGPYLIDAKSGQYTSSSEAASGLSPDGTQRQIYSTAKVVANGDGSVKSTATAGVEALSMGPLKILRFGSTETITETGDGKPTFTTQTELGTFEVAGIKVGITNEGFTVGPSTTTVPAAQAFETVSSTLAASGLQLAYIPRKVSKDEVSGVTSVVSGALKVSMFQDAPAVGDTTLTYVFGRALVSSSDVKDEPFIPELPVDLPEVSVPEAPPVSDGGTVVVDTPVAPDLGGGLDPAVSEPSVSVPTTDTPAVVAGAAPRQVLGLLRASGAPVSNSSSMLYLVMVLAGAGVLAGQQLFSRFGIQLMLRAT